MPSVERGIISEKGVDIKNTGGRDFKEKRRVSKRKSYFFPSGKRERR